MSKPNSFFDWQLTFRKKTDQIQKENFRNKINNNDVNINSLGISDKYFKDFMRNWKIKSF